MIYLIYLICPLDDVDHDLDYLSVRRVNELQPTLLTKHLVPNITGCGEFGWVGFLVVRFLHKINPNPRKIICCGKKWPKCYS